MLVVILHTVVGVMTGTYMTRFIFMLFSVLTALSIYATYTGDGLQEVDASSSTSGGIVMTSTRGGSYGHWSGGGGGGGGFSFGK